MSKLVFNVTLGGVLDSTRVVSILLQDKGGIYGMQDRATGEIIVPPGTAMTNVSPGVWEFDYGAEPLYNVRSAYDYVLRILQDDGDIFWGGGILPPESLASQPTTITGYARTFEELAQKVGRNLDDPFHERYSQETVIRELNFAFAEVAIETKSLYEAIAVQLIAGQEEYDIKTLAEGASLRDYIIAERITINGEDVPALAPTSQGVIDALLLTTGYEGRATKWMVAMTDYGTVKMWGTAVTDGDPLPATDGNIGVTYNSLPEYIDDPLSYPDPGIPPTYYEAAVKLATREVLLREDSIASFERAVSYSSGYIQDLALAMREINVSVAADLDMEPL